MNEIALFGEVYGDRRRGNAASFRGVRYYKGEEIPWKIHDCDDTNSCPGCRRIKREHIAALHRKDEPDPT